MLNSIVLPCLELFGLIHEGFEAGQCVGLLLSIIGHIEDGDIVIFFLISFKQGADNRPGHARKWHDIDNPTGTPFGKIDRLPNREDSLPLEGGVNVGFSVSKNGTGLGFPKVSEMAFKYFL